MKRTFFLYAHVVVQFKWGRWAVAQILILIHIAFSEHSIECLRVVNISFFTLDNAQFGALTPPPPLPSNVQPMAIWLWSGPKGWGI